MIIDVIEVVKVSLYTCAIIFFASFIGHCIIDKITEIRIQRIIDKELDGIER